MALDSEVKDFYSIEVGCTRIKLLAICHGLQNLKPKDTFLVTACFGILTFIFFWKVQYFYITGLRHYGIDLIWTYINHGTDLVCDVLT